MDLVDFAQGLAGMELLNEDLGNISLPAESVDLVMSRAVMEHITEPDRVYREIQRILKPGGHFVFLTANLWDYASIFAKLIPNRYHASIVSKMEGRAEHDVFPTAYRTNTRSAVTKWARRSGLELASFRYLGQYPSYFMFNGFLFLLATGYQKLISRATWLNFLQGWILVTLRKPEHRPITAGTLIDRGGSSWIPPSRRDPAVGKAASIMVWRLATRDRPCSSTSLDFASCPMFL